MMPPAKTLKLDGLAINSVVFLERKTSLCSHPGGNVVNMFFSQGVFVVVVVAFSFAVQLNSRTVTKSFFLNLWLSLLFFNLIL